MCISTRRNPIYNITFETDMATQVLHQSQNSPQHFVKSSTGSNVRLVKCSEISLQDPRGCNVFVISPTASSCLSHITNSDPSNGDKCYTLQPSQNRCRVSNPYVHKHSSVTDLGGKIMWYNKRSDYKSGKRELMTYIPVSSTRMLDRFIGFQKLIYIFFLPLTTH